MAIEGRRWSTLTRVSTPDIVLAAVATAICIAAIPTISPHGPLGLAVAANAVMAVPLAWRRVAPLAVTVIAIGAIAAQALIVGSVTNSVAQFAVLLVLMFSFGLYVETGRDALIGLALAVAGIYIVQFHDPTSTAIADRLVSPLVLPTLPFAAGRLLRRQQHTAARLRELTVELDHRREADAHAAVLAERARIAREVHDVVAHSVGVMLVQAGAAESMLEPDATASRTALEAVRDVGHEALVELRRLLQLLGSNDFDAAAAPQPGLAQLDRLVAQTRAAGLDVALDIDDSTPVKPLSPGVDLAAYRLVQEALTNVRKHAQARSAQVSIRYDVATVCIDVVDDGTAQPGRGSGSNESVDILLTATDGRGLVGMRERVALYQGTFSAGPCDTGGWRVRATLPRTDP